MQQRESKFEIVLPDGSIIDSSEALPEGVSNRATASKEPSHHGRLSNLRVQGRTSCERCGQCCLRDTPVILKDDIELLRDGVIREGELYTVREDQKIRSSIDGEFYYSSLEMIKIKPIFGSSSCLFFSSQEGCTIYEKRPTACRLYECWSDNSAITGIERRRLTRQDIFGEIDVLIDAIRRHEEKCSLGKLFDTVKGLREGKQEDFERIVEMILYDNSIRQWAKDRLGVEEEVLPLIFGKPLIELLPLYGVVIEREEENYTIRLLKEVEE